jgi:S-adenosylmethionine synthetase
VKIESLIHSCLTVSQSPFEVVEIKGRGHPDTICDLICERVSKDLLSYYQIECGRPLHYNVDKAFLVGGKALPRFGGGEVIEPAKLYLGDRATYTFEGRYLELLPIFKTSVESWLNENLRFLRLDQNLQFISEVKSGSASLSAVEERAVSNDTSVGVASWPPTPLETTVLAIERYLNSQEFKSRHPETGEDIKIMAIRELDNVLFIFAIAMVDRFIHSTVEYVAKKVTSKSDWV